MARRHRGVDLFFVISGFVMVHASPDLFEQPNTSAWFLKQRLIRIVPIYWAISAVLLAHALYRYADLPKLDLSWESIVASFFFVPMPRPSSEFSPLLKVGWTLNYEMLFYLIFVATLAFRRTVALLTVLGIIATLAIVSGAALCVRDAQARSGAASPGSETRPMRCTWCTPSWASRASSCNGLPGQSTDRGPGGQVFT